MRNNALDVIKGFAIFLVVIGHLIQGSIGDFDHNILWRFIYSFHMPLFFFVSGFLVYLTKSDGFDLISKRFKSLIIPFFMWAIVYYFVKEKSNIGLPQYIINVIITPDIGLWFLWVLFFCYLLFVFAKKIPINLYLSFVLISVFLLVFSIVIKNKIFGINIISKQFTFFFLGFLTNNYRDYVFEKIKKYKIVIFVFFIICTSCWMGKEDPLFYKYLNFGSLFILGYTFLVGILGILTCLSIFKNIKENTRNKFYLLLSYIGMHTLAIYAIHFLILDYIKLSYDGGVVYYLLIILFSIITIVLCIIIEYLISLSSIMSKLFFGKYMLKKQLSCL